MRDCWRAHECPYSHHRDGQLQLMHQQGKLHGPRRSEYTTERGTGVLLAHVENVQASRGTPRLDTHKCSSNFLKSPSTT